MSRDPSTGAFISYSEGKKFVGTARYASLSAHLGCEQSRRDDLESLCYALIYLMKGRLIWQGLQDDHNKIKHEKIMQLKKTSSISTICNGVPEELAIFLYYCRSLSFEGMPDYDGLKKQFKVYLSKKGYIETKFDWDMAKSKSKSYIVLNNAALPTPTKQNFALECQGQQNLDANYLNMKESDPTKEENKVRNFLSIPRTKLNLPSSNSLGNESNIAEIDTKELSNYKDSEGLSNSDEETSKCII